jgi:regulatory protein
MYDKKLTKTYSKEGAKPKLEKYCAYQERSHKQVFDKCRSYGLSESDSNEILVELIQSNFLNEERFVEAYVKGKFKIKSWGKQKITQGLKLAGINQKLISLSIQEIKFEDYIKTIQRLAEKKMKTLKEGTDFEKKIKTQRYLLSKGYSFDEVNKALNMEEYL